MDFDDAMSSHVEELFADALARPEGERAAFLDGACGDDAALRERILALLAAHAGRDSLLAEAPIMSRSGFAADEKSGDAIGLPSVGSAKEGHYKQLQKIGEGADLSSEANPGDRITRYKLLQKLGEGGCGVVWMAEQEEPVRRRVALKIIKLGMDTKAVVARFEAERQALAMMDHPCIAKVHDAGATETGRPFFVMELVRGIPITKYCDENHLTPTARLELFIKVCHAVQHAHQKGIIHRDIKPSNILVTVNDGAPTPKIIDFGIAKATQGRLTDATVFTAFEQFIGTPVYMSPEQAEMSSLDIDTRSDIYSLGILLYELLTGRPPFDPKKFAEVGVDGIRKQIREVEPPRPSARLSTLDADERTTIAKLRGTAPSNLSIILRGDLDWIVMRCIEKDRTRRYDTANGLAMDIQRYLRNEPVVARPPSTGYLVGKLIRRHRLMFVASSAVAAALVVGFGIALWSLVNEKTAREQARVAAQAERSMRERAQAAEAVGAAARTHSEDLVSFMLTDLSTELRLFGLSRVLSEAGERAVAYYESLAPSLRSTETIIGHGRALATSAAVLSAQGEQLAAERRFTQALLILSDVHLGPNFSAAARLARAEVLVNHAWFKFNELDYAGQLENAIAAETLLSPLLEVPGFAGQATRVLRDALHQKATATQFLNRVPESLPIFERAITLANAADALPPKSRYPGMAGALSAALLTEALFEVCDYRKAQELGERTYETLRAIIDRNPNLWTPRVWAGFARHYDSRVSFEQWDVVRGMRTAREAVECVRLAIERDPNALLERTIYAFMGEGEVHFRRQNGEWARLEELVRETNARFNSTGTNNKMQANHAITLAEGAALFAITGQKAQMNEWLAGARAKIAASVAALAPGSHERRFREAGMGNHLRRAALEHLDFAVVRADAEATLATLAELPATLGFNHKTHGGEPRGVAYFHLGQAAFFTSDYATAANAFDAAVAALDKWWSQRLAIPGTQKSRQDRADAVAVELYRAHALARAGRHDEARRAFAPVLQEVTTLFTDRADLFITQQLWAHAHWAKADISVASEKEKRLCLEEAHTRYRSAGTRLTRIQREVILPDIERSLAALNATEKP